MASLRSRTGRIGPPSRDTRATGRTSRPVGCCSGVQESSRRRINLGLAGFTLTVLVFYFSSVLDKLGRSAALLLGGALFLGVGWGVEWLRRRLVAGAVRAEAGR